MNTEKVKELKDYIQKSADLGQYYMLAGGKITMMKVVNYINELESENERLRLERDVLIGKKIAEKQKNDKALIMKIDIQEQLKDRIAELENQMCRNEDLHTATKKLNDTIILKQFAERLKEKYGKSCSEYYPLLLELTSEQLDETLKEFTE